MSADRRTAFRSIAANIRRLRVRRGLTQEKLAERADLAERYLQQVEAGSVNLSVGILVDLARALDVDPAVLLRPAELARPRKGRPRVKGGA
jgi:transcriptional regulator with XRE-family HTH domain